MADDGDEPEKPDRFYGYHHHHIQVVDGCGTVRVSTIPKNGGDVEDVYIPYAAFVDDYSSWRFDE